MTPKEYTEYLSRDLVALVAARAGTNPSYVYQIGKGNRGCSVKMAVALEEASKHYAKRPSDVMTAEEILNIDALRKERAHEVKSLEIEGVE